MAKDKMFKKITKEHKSWLSAVSIAQGISFDYLGITSKRLEILEEMGLIQYKEGNYSLTEKGKNCLATAQHKKI